MPALCGDPAVLPGGICEGGGPLASGPPPGLGLGARGALYLALLHDRLLPALGAVARHDARAEVLAVPGPLLHGVGLGVVAAAVGRGAALRQAELPAQRAVLLLHLAHAHLQALALAGGRVPGAVWLRLQRRQGHRLPICGGGKTGAG